MVSVWRYFLATGLLLTAVGTMAQERRVLSRTELDALVNPALSTIAQGALVAQPMTCDVGDIADDQSVNAIFTITNTTSEDIDVSEIRSSCGCLKVQTPLSSIVAGQSATLRAEFNPAGRNGDFSMLIHIYTTLDTHYPTLRLTVKGCVLTTDAWSHLPERMGKLRLSRKSVTFDRETRSERIAVANVGDRPIALSAQPTMGGITLRTEPEVIAPNAEGDIIISYAPQGDVMQDMETAIIVEGCGTIRPSERMIKITIKR